MKKGFLLLLGLLVSGLIHSQTYFDYIGAGHDQGISVITSDNAVDSLTGAKSIDGFPVTQTAALIDASRFLAQATMGYDYQTIEQVAAMGYEGWLEEQFSLPVNSLVSINDQIREADSFGDDDPGTLWGMYEFRSAWWNLTLKNPDVLRHRVAYAYSQIFVASAFGSDLFEDRSNLSSGYYDILLKHAFGNYRDLLADISRSPTMGLYLNHWTNPKSDPDNNIHPDENYAREIMQLFSIGLYELNNNGSRKLDENGNYIPTYNNERIREFAKIFTGFGDGRPDGEWGWFDYEQGEEVALLPMRMYEEFHEPGEKRLLNGFVVPAGQSGLEDFEDAIDNIFNHPNVGPFIGERLIKLLVTSNPSSAYINRVATAFNNNGNGVRGDLQAVIKAILLDPEARNCDPKGDPIGGKLREPLVRYSTFLKAFKARPTGNSKNLFVTPMETWQANTGQTPMYSASVFNFYLPDFQPNGPIAANDLVAPVFQIHNSSTSIGFVNQVNDWTFYDRLLLEEEDYQDGLDEDIYSRVALDLSQELALADQPEQLVQRLNILLAAGQLSERSSSIITNAVRQTEDPEEAVDLAIYLIMISPEFAVLK